ncbi:MAG: preprotein translocase subunit SecG [Vicinamibacteria bacterium]|nr:preprotein translocase subunit SecG [Vicinamibacteria bacterium]
MGFAYYLILLFHIVSCMFLIGVVLLQQGKNQDLASAFGGGGSQAAFGPRGSATILSRATTILAAVFMVTSLALSLVRPQARSVTDEIKAPAATQAATPAPEAQTPAVPSSGD